MRSHAVRFLRPFALVICYAASPMAGQQHGIAAPNNLANNTVLIIRHAEKPPAGSELTPAGHARARAYTSYFEPFHEGSFSFRVSALYAGADSESSIRPRQTLEPLSQATGMPLNTTISTKDPKGLIALLRSQPHGSYPLIAWRHGQMPALLAAFGAPQTLLPQSKWPDDVFDWVIALQFDAQGQLLSSQLLKEHLTLSTE